MPQRTLVDHPGLARVIEKQMRNWEISRSQHPEAAHARRRELGPFVTISNIVGSGGNDVATSLGEALHWPVFDRQILTAMAGDDAARAQLYRSMDERDLGWFEDVFRSLMQREFCKNDYFHRLTETILFLARKGPAVFVGRSADLILPRDHGLRVKVIASPERRAQNFARRDNLPLDQARRQIERIERERNDFVRTHFHIDPTDPTRFDLLINLDRFTSRQAVDFILFALRSRGITAHEPQP